MLGKLLKHEFRAMSRLLLPLHIFLILISIVIRVLVTGQFSFNAPTPVVIISLVTYILFLVAVPLGTFFLVVVRFYKHLFTDEGYLSLTLPVTPGQHLLTKTIIGGLWHFIDALCVCLSIVLVAVTPESIKLYNKISTEFSTESGMEFLTFFMYLIVLILISALFTAPLGYVCIAIGQLFSNHRILVAIITYFGISTITQITVSIYMAVNGLIGINEQYYEALQMQDYFGNIIRLSAVMIFVEFIVSYIVTYIIMKKRINLI